MKALLITVAGTSSRFGRSLGRECLKCLYYRNKFSECLLSRLIRKAATFDKYIIVGGYKFDELEKAVKTELADISDKIVLLKNEHYADYASGYSLYIGLQYAVKNSFDEVVFAEGDLHVDARSFDRAVNACGDVITYNGENIDAKKSVVFYYDAENTVHYIYDTAHNCLEIREPFLSVYNSGQIWKFANADKIETCFSDIDEKSWRGTNLVFIQKYFGKRDKTDYSLVKLDTWINCNTVEDFDKITEES